METLELSNVRCSGPCCNKRLLPREVAAFKNRCEDCWSDDQGRTTPLGRVHIAIAKFETTGKIPAYLIGE